MRKIIDISKWILAISLLVILILFTNNRHKAQLAQLGNIQIKLSEQNFVDKKSIIDYLEDRSVSFGRVLMNTFSKDHLEQVLLSHPAIKDVQVFSNHKGVIDILIEQKKAIIRIKTANDDYYLDESGEKMTVSSDFVPKLLIASGNVKSRHYAGIYKFMQVVHRVKFWQSQITQLYFEDEDIFLIPRVGSQRISIGSFKNIEGKLANLYQFYKVIAP